MELYIEKEFLDDFFADYSDEEIKVRLKNVFTEYGAKQVFIDYNSEDFHQFLKDNTFFEMMASNDISPISVESIEEDLFKNSNFNQTLVFTQKEKIWFNKAENMGALCFSFDNYEEKIKELIDKLHFKVNLSIPFNNWNALDFSTIPFNSVQITDGYILKDEKNTKENLIPLINSFVHSKKGLISIDLLVKEIVAKNALEEKRKEFVKKQHSKLNSIFSDLQIRFTIYVSNLISDIDFHDRTVVTNFSILDSGVGFSLVNKKISNSQMISESIFEKYTYDRLRGLRAYQQKYINKLNSNSFQSLKFYKFP
ncbi:MAG: hypothetical protein ACJA2M_002948 [Polaribacter sp.]|jgi:hypothetical protein